jgi:DNA polymerase I-like protein with 3'-5' exonuclease and polymerase domains
LLGLSDGIKIVSVPFAQGKEALKTLLRRYPRATIVGHNYLQSDLQVLENVGIKTNPKQVVDTIVYYWLTHAHLCKTSQKDADGESTRRGAGFMNLWTMLSLTTDLPNYKLCHETACDGTNCPIHDEPGYNGIDAWGPVMATPKLIQMSQLLGVDKLYDMHRDLALVLYEMQKTGVLIDMPYVDKLRANWEKAKNIYYDKETKLGALPFNPDSPKQVHDYFANNKVEINGKKRVIALKNSREETIKNAIERMGLSELDDVAIEKLAPPIQALFALRDWKAQGDGPDRWFAPRYWDEESNDWEGYVDDSGYVHPRLGYYTSTARMMCTSPNMQNVPARRKDPITGEKMKTLIRRAIIAPPGYYLLKGDYSNAENRTFLHMAGYTNIPLRGPDGAKYDLHAWVAQIAGIRAGDPIAEALGGPRDAAKSVQHAGNYLEGLDLLWPSELRDDTIRAEIRAGARLVYPKWTFQEKVVTFTGTNLARRMFGSATWENRRKALQISQAYFTRFPKVRGLQQAITRQAENENMVRPPNGYVLRSYGYPAERMKTACATWGSQPVAHFTKLALLNLWQVRDKVRPILQIHDEVLCRVPMGIKPAYAKKLFIEAMQIETADIPGLKLPVDVETGKSWGDTREI